MNGKLYVMGGGWSRLAMASSVANMSLGVRIEVPWDQANVRQHIRAYLVDADGQPVLGPEDAGPVQVEGDFEVGRPPGTTRGSPLVTTFALRFEGLPLEAGSYTWRLDISEETVAVVRFEVVKG